MSDLYRAEIISNQSVEEDIIERLEEAIPSIEYTVIPEIHGRGLRSKKTRRHRMAGNELCAFFLC